MAPHSTPAVPIDTVMTVAREAEGRSVTRPPCAKLPAEVWNLHEYPRDVRIARPAANVFPPEVSRRLHSALAFAARRASTNHVAAATPTMPPATHRARKPATVGAAKRLTPKTRC